MQDGVETSRKSAACPLTTWRGELWPPPGSGVSLGRSRSRSNHHVCVFVSKHDLSYTQAERAIDRGKRRRRSLSLSRRDPDTSHHKDRGGRLRSTRARRRRAPVDATGRRREYTRSSSGERAAHISYLKANPQQAASHSKTNTRREGFAQRLTKDPAPHRLVDPSTAYK